MGLSSDLGRSSLLNQTDRRPNKRLIIYFAQGLLPRHVEIGVDLTNASALVGPTKQGLVINYLSGGGVVANWELTNYGKN